MNGFERKGTTKKLIMITIKSQPKFIEQIMKKRGLANLTPTLYIKIYRSWQKERVA